MESWTERTLGCMAVGLMVACGAKSSDSAVEDSGAAPGACDTSPWTWQNTGEPFMRTWCTSCHHPDLPEGQRQGAPVDVNLDTHSDVRMWADRIQARVWTEDAPMPPVGVPTEGELEALAEWLDCGAPD